ncbi:MAG: hypothetical protein Unbinned585contig1001_40 [Prokaryotic dsDNA virus sp.]|nr:MAG: hypothetical protein Unbinned585contig1001_40 [Prokaryotic dsDNA virus sp.]|tara:strand:+ start:922 stop:1413 length:492 start_codon:yes stop_codon:yes gene_type:complete
MISFRNVVGFLETIADKHYEIKSFHSGFMDEVDINKLGATDYIILYAEPGQAVVDKGVLTYNFTLYVLDMINEDLGDAPNKERLGRIDTLSENLSILQDVINEFHHSLYSTSWVDNEVVLDLPITAEPFTARFNNLLTGWSATLSMQVNNPNNLCISPIEANS